MPSALIDRRIPTSLRNLAWMFDQPPRANMVSTMALGPVVENHLAKDFTSVFVNKMIQLDQVDSLPDRGRL